MSTFAEQNAYVVADVSCASGIEIFFFLSIWQTMPIFTFDSYITRQTQRLDFKPFRWFKKFRKISTSQNIRENKKFKNWKIYKLNNFQ